MITPKHIQKSFNRTGKYYGEVHYWMDEGIGNNGDVEGGRGTLNHSYEALAIIEKKWGIEARNEAIEHLKDDRIIDDDGYFKKRKLEHGIEAFNVKLMRTESIPEATEVYFIKEPISLNNEVLVRCELGYFLITKEVFENEI